MSDLLPTPRKSNPSGLTDQQEKFALRYAVDFDSRAAITEAGYSTSSGDVMDQQASKLLRNVKVRAFLWNVKAEWSSRYRMDSARWFDHLQLVAMEAFEEHDWTGCVSALREIGRHLGLYERDLRQKYVSPEDVERIKAELEARGVSFERVNAPPHLKFPETDDGGPRPGTG